LSLKVLTSKGFEVDIIYMIAGENDAKMRNSLHAPLNRIPNGTIKVTYRGTRKGEYVEERLATNSIIVVMER